MTHPKFDECRECAHYRDGCRLIDCRVGELFEPAGLDLETEHWEGVVDDDRED